MEKPQPAHQPPPPLSPPEWEALFDDFQHGGSRRDRWTSSGYTGLVFLDLSLSTALRRDFPLNVKFQLLVFLDEFFSDALLDRQNDCEPRDAELVLTRLVDALRGILQSPIDGISATYALREQMMISATSVFVTLRNGDGLVRFNHVGQLQRLTELLLTVINRPNSGQDRQVRATACECLRELERAYPCLLSEIGGHLWGLCQSERTHAAQSYVLLLAAVIHGIVMRKPNVSILNTSTPFVPFNVPQFLITDTNVSSKEITSSGQKGLKRVISFLLEWPHFLTSSGMMEFMSMILPVATALDLQASLLKVQFSGLLYTFDPLLCHSFLMMHSHFSDSIIDQSAEIVRRLVSISCSPHYYLVFRLLALHWLMAFNGGVAKTKAVLDMRLSFYPSVYDPLALKSLKLDLIAYCSILLDNSRDTSAEVISGDYANSGGSAADLFKDSIVSVSAFKWLPHWSTETMVAFRAFHRFLVGSLSHSDGDHSLVRVLIESSIFCTLQKMLVDMALEFKGLVPVIVVFITRFLGCHKHFGLGERLLQTFDKNLLPKVFINYQLACYFSVFRIIAENETVPPYRLIELLSTFMIFLAEKHGPDTGLKSWSLGSKVLGICRTMIVHHHSSRLFIRLSRLLAFTCMYFPDLAIRDDARIYLRMLTCVPGKKLRLLLNSGDQLPGVAPSQPSSCLNAPSPRPAHDLKKSRTISSYIHIERMTPLLIKQSWSLSLSTLGVSGESPPFVESIKGHEPSEDQSELDKGNNIPILLDTERTRSLRVMDSKISGILETLRRHFSLIPDFRHMAGLKVRISCGLRFEAEAFNHTWAAHSCNQPDMLPAMYASVLSFSSSASYGPIPPCHVPFLLSEPEQSTSLDIIPVDNDGGHHDNRKFILAIEMEPREPTPGIIDVSIEANTENGQIIHGQLRSIAIGIEDMFLMAVVPPEMPEDAMAGYCMDLFNALWEACGSSTGMEAFLLKEGKGVAAISGTQSVKLVEAPAVSLIQAVECYLARFVVGIMGGPLVGVVKGRGIIKEDVWMDVGSEVTPPILLLIGPGEDDEGVAEEEDDVHVTGGRNLGCFLVLIFLPPRFHLLFRMEVRDFSTLVWIRTDHWPCLAYVDDYLEALFST